MVSTTTDSPTAVTEAHTAPADWIARAKSVSQGVRTSAIRRRNQVLARSPSRSHGVRSENRNAAVTMRTANRSHAVVLMDIGCGSGGGAPVGRRWRRARWAGESLGRPTGLGGLGWLGRRGWPAGLGGPAGAGARSALSPTAPPRLLGVAPAPAGPPRPLLCGGAPPGPSLACARGGPAGGRRPERR